MIWCLIISGRAMRSLQDWAGASVCAPIRAPLRAYGVGCSDPGSRPPCLWPLNLRASAIGHHRHFPGFHWPSRWQGHHCGGKQCARGPL